MKQSNGFLQESMATEEVDIAPISNEKVEMNNVSPAAEEFSLAPIKSKSVPLFKQQALYKSRLKSCIFLHLCFCLVLLAKLSEDILDRMQIFILQLEELYIPKPLFLEYVYASSIFFSIFALRALAHNNLGSLKAYAASVVFFSIGPLLIVAIYFLNDVMEYADQKNEAAIEKWNGFPICLIYYGYILIALQIHFFSIYFTAKLIKIWKTKMKKY